MNKIDGIKMFIKNPLGVIKEGVRVYEQTVSRNQVKEKYAIDQLPTLNLLELFPDLNEDVSHYSFLSGTSMITDLILLKSLARKFENCKYFEIGSWRGESLANVNEVTSDCTSLTLSGEQMRALNYPQEFVDVHGVYTKHIDSINVIENDSHKFDFGSLNKTFDLIFVDGDHSYDGVLNDTKKVFPLRSDDKSIIVWHDYSFNSEDVRHTTLKAILDGIPKEYHKNLYHVSNTMCAVYIEDLDLKTTMTKFPSFPDKKFSLKVKAEKF